MFYFRLSADTPYCGTENIDYRAFETRPTNAELDEMVEEFVRLNGESFEYLVTGWDHDEFEDEDKEAQALEDYYADCMGAWEEITEEEFEENS